MIDTVKERLAWSRAKKLVRKRAARVWTTPANQRSVLLVLPRDQETARHAWRFVSRYNLDPQRTLPVVPAGEITYAPVEFLGRVRALESGDIGAVGLPKKPVLKELWEFDADVAMALDPDFDLAAAVIVGASRAPFRIGFTGPGSESFFDLMVSGSNPVGALDTLAKAIERIKPPVLERHPDRSHFGTTAAW